MDPEGTAPPAAESCLVSSYASRGVKGGTLIEETVKDLETHQKRMQDPASYRPEECRCGGRKLHIHGRRERKLIGSGILDGGVRVVTVMVFLCVACSATWRVLPGFLARHLWRTWAVVEGGVQGTRGAEAPKIPERTQSRWRARLSQTARLATQVLATAGTEVLRKVAQGVSLNGSRKALAVAYAARFGGTLLSPLAAMLHRLCPGVRLM